MTRYAAIEAYADLGGIEAHPDRTAEARSDDPTNENGPGTGGNRSEANVPNPTVK